MQIIGDFTTSVHRALEEIDPNYEKYSGFVICGTHNPEKWSVDAMLADIKFARTHHMPTLLICFGHQLGAIEYARNVLGIKDATSEEFGIGTFVVKKRPELKVGVHDGETWWSNYETIEWTIPEHFIAVPYHPEYGSRKGKFHPDLVRFINICKSRKKKNLCKKSNVE